MSCGVTVDVARLCNIRDMMDNKVYCNRVFINNGDREVVITTQYIKFTSWCWVACEGAIPTDISIFLEEITFWKTPLYLSRNYRIGN